MHTPCTLNILQISIHSGEKEYESRIDFKNGNIQYHLEKISQVCRLKEAFNHPDFSLIREGILSSAEISVGQSGNGIH